MSKHQNNGSCPQCLKILNRYKDPHPRLLTWFLQFQKNHPEAHCSCAGRGEIDQEAAFIRKASKARWLQSAHNYNAALDLFEMSGKPDIYEKGWFDTVLAPNLPDFLEWYGRPGAPFYELPHVEIKKWKQLVSASILEPVE